MAVAPAALVPLSSAALPADTAAGLEVDIEVEGFSCFRAAGPDFTDNSSCVRLSVRAISETFSSVRLRLL